MKDRKNLEKDKAIANRKTQPKKYIIKLKRRFNLLELEEKQRELDRYFK